MSKKTRRAKARRALLSLSLVLVVACAAVGGTIAWLQDETKTVTNTFTTSDITIWMTETVGEDLEDTKENAITNDTFQIIPGGEEEKDPAVVVEAGSEPCWVFVKVLEDDFQVTVDDETYGFGDFITYTVDEEEWTAVEGVDNVYYAQIEEIPDEEASLNVLADTKVEYLSSITKAMLNALETESVQPTLTFQAWAIQSANLKTDAGNLVTTAEDAWALLSAN